MYVSPSQEVLNLGRSLGCEAVKEGDSGVGLNRAVELGIRFSERLGADGVLIVLADLPLIGSEDVDGLVSAGLRLEKPYVVLSPSRNGGTNAMLLSLPAPITLRFGADSFASHLYEARRAGVNLLVFHSKRISLDVDSYVDIISSLKEAGDGGGRSIAYLRNCAFKRGMACKAKPP